MVKNVFLFIGVVLFCSLVACTNEDESKSLNEDKSVINSSIQQVSLCGITVENRNGTLAFENKEQISELVKNISDISVPAYILKSTFGSTNLNQISVLKKNGFTSLYDIYVEAMNEAESYYERQGGYEEFKAKYSSLFFPEEGEDYSAYLPVSNKELAKLADKNGNVIVDGKITSLIDVATYQQLQDLGMTPPSKNKTRATSGTNGIEEEKAKDNKVWVICSKTKDGSIPVIKVEVCFRKKNFIGMWYNHNSGTSAYITSGVNLSLYSRSMTECFGFSSHDYYYAIRSNGIETALLNEKITINHNGTGKTLTLHVSYPVALL